jgi:hypothetical protein
MRIKRGQKRYQSRGLPLRMCRQGLFYIFNQASSLNLKKIIQRHIIGKKWLFFFKLALYIGFLPLGTSMPCMLTQYTPAHCTAMSCMATTCKSRHAPPHQAWPRHARQCSALNALCKN